MVPARWMVCDELQHTSVIAKAQWQVRNPSVLRWLRDLGADPTLRSTADREVVDYCQALFKAAVNYSREHRCSIEHVVEEVLRGNLGPVHDEDDRLRVLKIPIYGFGHPKLGAAERSKVSRELNDYCKGLFAAAVVYSAERPNRSIEYVVEQVSTRWLGPFPEMGSLILRTDCGPMGI